MSNSGPKAEMRLAQSPLATRLDRIACFTRGLLNPAGADRRARRPCSSMRDEPDQRPARNPGQAPIAPPFFSGWRPDTRSSALPFHDFLRANAGRDRAKDSVALFLRRGPLLCGLVLRVTTSSLLPHVLFPATGAD